MKTIGPELKSSCSLRESSGGEKAGDTQVAQRHSFKGRKPICARVTTAWVIGIGISLVLPFAFPRRFGIALVALVTLVGGAFLYFKVDSKAKDGVEIRVAYDKSKCNRDHYPLFVEVYNGSRSTVKSISFVVTAHRPGHSNNIADYNPIDADAIIMQKTSYMYCVLLPSLNPYLGDPSNPESLVWGVENAEPRFQ